MTKSEFFREGDEGRWYKLHYTSCLNRRYHQVKAAQNQKKQMVLLIASGVLGVFVMLVSTAGGVLGDSAFWNGAAFFFGFASVALAYITAVLPYQKNSVDHQFMCRRWNDLRRELEVLRHDVEVGEDPVPSSLLDKMRIAEDMKVEIESEEPSDLDKKLLDKLNEEELYRRYNVRTYDEVAKLRKKGKRWLPDWSVPSTNAPAASSQPQAQDSPEEQPSESIATA